MGQYEKVSNEQLIKEIIQKEAKTRQLDFEVDRAQKQINNIKRSNTWKFAQPFINIKRFFTKLFRRESQQEQANYIHQLEDHIHSLEDELEEVKEKLHQNMLDTRSLNRQQMMNTLREKKIDGTLIDYLETAIEQKNAHVKNYNEALIYAARLFMNEQEEQRNLVYNKVLKALNAEEIPEFMVRPGLSDEPLPLTHVSSFRGSLSKRVRQKQYAQLLPEYTLENKIEAYDFVDALDVRRPELIEGEFSMIDVPKKEGTVIKPVDGAGSRGVYLLYSLNDIIDIRRSKQLTSLGELAESMQKDLTIGWVEEDNWMVEQLILENKQEKLPARDLKFYSFYGKIGLILEITRFPERKHCWWTATGERIRTGKYEEDLFKGQGVTEEELQLAEEISLQIPAPFIRIDFLRSEEGLVFGEFTAKPGNYDDFDDETDQWLGDYYTEAETRLTEDLLAGKKFTEYKGYIEKQGYIIRKDQQLKSR